MTVSVSGADEHPAGVGVAMVIPCYDEEARLDPSMVLDLAGRTGATVHLVDDGSTDSTWPMLAGLAAGSSGSIVAHRRPVNTGKAEAVRYGMLAARRDGHRLVGYCDADFATPVDEVARLVMIAEQRPEVAAVIAARVGLLGHDVERSMMRHYLGRVFATASGTVLGVRVYDTQCGAKVFRATQAFDDAISEPFTSRWAFDVELIGRLLAGKDGGPGTDVADLLEVPLHRWNDVGGSKLGPLSSVRAGLDLVAIRHRLRRW